MDLAVEGCAPGLCVNVSPTALRRSLSALVTNALSHTPSGGRVRVWASTSGEFVVLPLAETGTGIRGIDPDRVFDRFAHGAPGALPSHGVGLALVRDTAAQAGGTVAVESTGPRGTTMSLMLKEAR